MGKSNGGGNVMVYGDQKTISMTPANRKAIEKWAKDDNIPVATLFAKMMEAERAKRERESKRAQKA